MKNKGVPPQAGSGCQPSPSAVPASRSGISNADKIAVAVATIQRIAAIAEDTAWQAGVGSMETAGSFISYLAVHPEQVEGFLSGADSCVDWPSKWHIHGCLSWHGMDGKIHRPEDASAIEARSGETGAGSTEGESAVGDSRDAQKES